MRQLYESDYRVRCHIARCLENRVLSCKRTQNNQDILQETAFELAVCYEVGFGVVKDDQIAQDWLQKSQRQDGELRHEISLVAEEILDSPVHNGKFGQLSSDGYIQPIDFGEYYGEHQQLERAEQEYKRDIESIGIVMGDC